MAAIDPHKLLKDVILQLPVGYWWMVHPKKEGLDKALDGSLMILILYLSKLEFVSDLRPMSVPSLMRIWFVGKQLL